MAELVLRGKGREDRAQHGKRRHSLGVEAKVAALGGGVFPPYVVDGQRKAPMGP